MLGTKFFSRGPRLAYVVGAALSAATLVVHSLATGTSVGVAALRGVLVAALLMAGPGSMYVRADEDGVTVRNLVRTHRVPWSEVRGFTLDEGFPHLAHLDRVSGPEIAVLAISDEPWFVRDEGHERNIAILDGLNREWRNAVLEAQSQGPTRFGPAVGVSGS